MSNDLSTERTSVVAIFSTRHDAAMARDRLDDENIRAFVSADDAGGMHPQLQRSNGTKLVVLQRDAERAYEALKEADMLPRVRNDERRKVGRDVAGGQVQQQHGREEADTFTFSLKHRFILTTVLLVLFFGIIILVLVLGSL